MAAKIVTDYDDGDAWSQSVYDGDRLIGCIWMDGEGMGYNVRATSNYRGYWAKDVTHFQTAAGALYGLLHQAKFEHTL